MINTPNKIIVHHALSAIHHTVADVDKWHKARWPGFVSDRGYHVGYHFVIDYNGKVTQTRDYKEEGAHCIGQNTQSIGVCFMGNFDSGYPSKAQEEAWINLYEKIVEDLPNCFNIRYHRDYANKSCPGSQISDNYFANLVDHQYKLALIEKLQMLVSRLRSLLSRRRMK